MSDKKFIDKNQFLRPENMILLYARGAFPMADDSGEIIWYMPEERTIIPLNKFNVPRTLKKFMNESNFEYEFDKRIMDVIENCARRDRTWISPELVDAYKGLMKMNHGHSFHCREKKRVFAINYMFLDTYPDQLVDRHGDWDKNK